MPQHRSSRAPRRPPQNPEVVIEGMAGGGAGLARLGRSMVFVPFTIPGERVEIRITGEQDGALLAEGVRLIEASADRVYPACEGYFREGCVRCAWQHIAYTAQPLLKQDVLAEHLSRIAGLSSPPVEATIPALQPWAFLHHATWQVSEGRLLLPGRMGGSVPHRECALLHPDLLDLYAQLDFTAQDLADVSRVRLQRGSDGGRMLILSVRTEAAPELELDTDVSVNLILPDNEPVNLVGESAVRLQVGDAWLRATAGAYFRPNVPMLGVLAHTVRVLLQVQPGEAVLDLYAGIGVFSHALAVDAARVTLVESYPPAVTDADENLRAFEHIDVIEGGVEAVLPALDGPYAAAVIDPPRGMADEVIAEVERLGVRRALILADDPAEAGRHVRRMRRRGWTLARALAIDLMPQTAFVDSILLFHRE